MRTPQYKPSLGNNMPRCIFVLGVAGTGKSSFCEKFVKEESSKGNLFVLIDKDTIAERACDRLIALIPELKKDDRDSELYSKHIRDIEYGCAVDYARSCLSLGQNCILPAPWTKELKEGSLTNERLGFPKDCTIELIALLSPPEDQLKNRIKNRNHPKDNWKLSNWNDFYKRVMDYEAMLKKIDCKFIHHQL